MTTEFLKRQEVWKHGQYPFDESKESPKCQSSAKKTVKNERGKIKTFCPHCGYIYSEYSEINPEESTK